MYDVPMTPTEVWLGIAVFAIVIAVLAMREKIIGPHPMTDEEYREACEKRDRKCREFFKQYKKDHPEIWDENGNLHDTPKATD